MPQAESLLRRAARFVRERPGTTLLLGAGAAALTGAEWAFGALLGGAAMLAVARRTAPEERRKLLERGRRSLQNLRARISEAMEEPPTTEPPATQH